MAQVAWGFDINNATDFTGAGPDDWPAWADAVDTMLLREKYSEATQEADERLSKARKDNDGVAEAMALHLLAKVHLTSHSYDFAVDRARQAMDAYTASLMPKGAACCRLLLAKAAMDFQRYEEAEEIATQALEEFLAIGSRSGEGAAHHAIARIRAKGGANLDGAMEEADKAVTAFDRAGDKEGKAATLIVKGNVLCWSYHDGKEAAGRLAREAAGLCKKLKTPAARHREAEALFLVATVSVQQGKPRDGLKAARESVDLAKEWGGPRSQASCMRAASVAQMQCGDLAAAADLAAETLRILRSEATDDALIAEAMAVEAMVARQRYSRREVASEADMLEKTRDVLEAFVKSGDEQSIALHRLELAQALLMTGDASAALTEASISLEQFEESGMKELQAMCLMTMTHSLRQGGDTKAALQRATQCEKLTEDPSQQTELGQLIPLLKKEVRRPSGPSWSNTTSWETPEQKIEPPSTHDSNAFGVKRSTYSDIFSNRIRQGGDTPDPICFDTPGVLMMDVWLGVHMPFLPTEKQAVPGQPQMAAPSSPGSQPVAKARNQEQASLAALAGDYDSGERRPAAPKAPSGPIIIRPRIVGDDVLGGRQRDVPEDLHSRMVMLAKRSDVPITTPAKRTELQKKKPTFHGHHEWRDASRWGYISPPDLAPKGCRWQRMTVGWRLSGPSPEQLFGGGTAANQVAAFPAAITNGTTNDTVEGFLRGARPDWAAGEVSQARQKLEAMRIQTTADLASALGRSAPARDCGGEVQEALGLRTVQALRAFSESRANSEPWLGPAAARFSATTPEAAMAC